MIVANIKGGLGNQLFQYAAGRSMAERYETELKIDLSFFDHEVDGQRAYQSPSDTVYLHLGEFAITAGEASASDIEGVIRFGRRGKRVAETLTGSRIAPILEPVRENYGLAGRFLNYYGERTADEGRFNLAMREAGPECYLNGYWESPRYFEDIRSTLESEFTPKNQLSERSQAVAERMRNTRSVGLHVRRGDVVDFDNALPVDYFEAAIEAYGEDDVRYFIFSVDPDWVRENISIDAPVEYVDHHHPEEGTRTPNAWEYFVLMNQCDDKIISNSTFSWWAAWLNQSDDTRVLCPAVWKPTYPESGMRYVSNLDLIPESWNVVRWN